MIINTVSFLFLLPFVSAVYLNDSQRQSSNNEALNKKILVYNLGERRFGVSILNNNNNNGVIELVSISGDSHLGEEDFDDRVMEHFIKLIKKKYNQDISKDKRALEKLRRECGRAKRALISSQFFMVEIESLLFHGTDFSEALTRARFEELNMDLFKKTLGPVKKALESSCLNKSDINVILLVGLTSRIPKIVEELLKHFFNRNEDYNPEQVDAYGAQVQAMNSSPREITFLYVDDTDEDEEEEVHSLTIPERKRKT